MLNEVELEELRMALAECEQKRGAVNENAFTAIREARSLSFLAAAPGERRGGNAVREPAPDLRSAPSEEPSRL